ncbi:hypothetical protein ANTPLA_LOCUS4352 [Anthophora plagiata]
MVGPKGGRGEARSCLLVMRDGERGEVRLTAVEGEGGEALHGGGDSCADGGSGAWTCASLHGRPGDSLSAR